MKLHLINLVYKDKDKVRFVVGNLALFIWELKAYHQV
jgi:hypothetical protein